jgi:hypothetical protein
MAGFWPLYSNFSSKAQVTLALPGKPSPISKSVGGNSPAMLLVPNVDFLLAFIKGNIGIADSMSNASMLKNLNSPIAANSEMVTRQFSKVNKLGLEGKLDTFKDPKGKIKIPKSEIKIDSSNDSLGFKAMEKTILTSIFETQKPYMEIAKMVIDVLVSAEDIIARIMPLLSVSPLTFKSDKPIGNGGEGKRPKAIGYQGGKDIKEAIAALDKMTKMGGKLAVDKDGSPKRNPPPKEMTVPAPLSDNDGASDESLSQNEKLKEMGKTYNIIDAKYSTGNYDPTIDYVYTYIDLPAEAGMDDIQPEPDTAAEEEDPYSKYKPKRIILGVFDSKGVPLNLSSKLFSVSQTGKSITDFKVADWIEKSPKWVFPKSTSPNLTVWPSFETPIFRWEKNGILQAEGQSAPSTDGWQVKKYKKGQKNELNGFDAIEGDPIIVGFGGSDLSNYTSYITEYTTISMRMATELDQAEKDEYTKKIVDGLNVKAHLENIALYAQAKSAVYKDFDIPGSMKIAFKPMQITIEEAKSDPKLAGLDGKIWIDPESDYETKIIAVKPVTKKIAYSTKKGQPEVQVDIKSFIKNRAIIKFKNGEKFNIDILKNGGKFDNSKDIDQYILENWNYDTDTKQVNSNNSYSMDIWSANPVGTILNKVNGGKLLMGKDTGYTQHGNYQISIEKSNGSYTYDEKDYNTTTGLAEYDRYFSDGVKKLGDGTIVFVQNKKIVKWYFLCQYIFDNGNLPTFGRESTIAFDLDRKVDSRQFVPGINSSYSEPTFLESSISISPYQIKVSNNDFPYGTIIDSSNITNEQLTKDELYSTGRYGSGSPDDPQELGIVYRYALTDLDEETYYIIEGIRTDDNVQIDNTGGDKDGASKNGKATPGQGGGVYRLPHAVGAIMVFIKMLVKIFSKLIPAIMKLLKLFKNPMGFITDIIMEKIGESFSIFSPPALNKFGNAKDLIKLKKDFTKPTPPAVPGEPTPAMPKMGDYVNIVKGFFENSKLKNHVAVDSLGTFKDASGKLPKTPPKDSIGNFKFLMDGIGFIPFTIFGKDLSFGLELKMANIITKEWGKPVPMRLIFNKEKNSKDPNNLNVTGPPVDDGNSANNKEDAKKETDTNSDNNSKLKQGKDGSLDPNKRYTTISTWYSTGEFVKGTDYKYIYIDQEESDLFAEVDRLSDSIDPADLQDAKRKLEDAQAKDPEDEAIKNKLDEIKKKIFDLNSNTQPLLKMILGIVTLPVKVVAGIVQWIMDFFKSLANPMALPGKIIEFLSFKWMMDFFSPKGLLKLAGIDFDLSLIPQWIAKAKETKSEASTAAGAAASAGAKAGETAAKAKDVAGKAKDISPNDAKAAAQEKIPSLPKGVPAHKGSYALPDDFELVDLTKFLNISFLPSLPTYTVQDIREQPKIAIKFFVPIICFIEKLINGFIDFIWATLGIECLIPPPHIKLCNTDDPDSMDPVELGKILNGETPSGEKPSADVVDFKTDILATMPEYSDQSPPLEKYVYDVTLSNGETVRLTDKESLDKFIEDSKDTGFDFQF